MTILDLFGIVEAPVKPDSAMKPTETAEEPFLQTYVYDGPKMPSDPFTCTRCQKASERVILTPGTFRNPDLCGTCDRGTK